MMLLTCTKNSSQDKVCIVSNGGESLRSLLRGETLLLADAGLKICARHHLPINELYQIVAQQIRFVVLHSINDNPYPVSV